MSFDKVMSKTALKALSAAGALVLLASAAAAQHQHGKPGRAPEAFTAAPAFAPSASR